MATVGVLSQAALTFTTTGTPDVVLTKTANGHATFSCTGGAGTVELSGITDPLLAQDAATKAYVDNLVNGLSWKNPCSEMSNVVVTFGAVGNSSQVATAQPDTGGATYTVANVGTRILVSDQNGSTPDVGNGIYVLTLCTNTSFFYWARTTDMATGSDASGAATYIEGGSSSGKSFVQNQEPAVVDTDPIYFVLFASTTSSVAGSDTWVQYNNGGTFGASADFTFNKSATTPTLSITGGSTNNQIVDGTINVTSVASGADTVTSTSATSFTVTSSAANATFSSTSGSGTLSGSTAANVQLVQLLLV